MCVCVCLKIFKDEIALFPQSPTRARSLSRLDSISDLQVVVKLSTPPPLIVVEPPPLPPVAKSPPLLSSPSSCPPPSLAPQSKWNSVDRKEINGQLEPMCYRRSASLPEFGVIKQLPNLACSVLGSFGAREFEDSTSPCKPFHVW